MTKSTEIENSQTEYSYNSSTPSHTNAYLWPHVFRQLSAVVPSGGRVFDLGCGNGALMIALEKRGYDVTGVDPSQSGVSQAKATHPKLDVHVGSSHDDLPALYGRFPSVVSLEVVEHVYAPRDYALCLYNLVEPGGVAIISTPYHGYFKNLLLALSGRLDSHFTALWDHGHIKFWSVRTLTILLEQAGFSEIQFMFAGRIYPFSKSMIAVAHRAES